MATSVNDSSNDESGVSRRRMLQVLGASTTAGLAGCSGENPTPSEGDPGTDDGTPTEANELGERVPTQAIEYWSNYKASQFEAQVPIIGESLAKLGLDWEAKPTEFSKTIGYLVDDARTANLPYWLYNPSPGRLDPFELLHRLDVNDAGTGMGTDHADDLNWTQYTSCEYTVPATQSDTAASVEERQQLVTEALSHASADGAIINTVTPLRYGAARNNKIELTNVGDAGILRTNNNLLANMTVDGDRAIVDATSEMAVRKPLQSAALIPRIAWNHLMYSTLMDYNENYELEPLLASSVDIEGGKTFTFELRDATFHDGSPITAEDVKFSFEHYFNNTSVYIKATEMPLESIEVIDDKTVEFNFSKPYLPFLNVESRRWAILSKEHWEQSGMANDPVNSSREFVGSGPFKVDNLEPGQFVRTSPHDGHPVFSPDHGLTFKVYDSQQTKFQAFQNGEVDIITELTGTMFERVQNQMGDRATTAAQKGFTGFYLLPQHSFAPYKFKALRMAVGAVINRKKLNDVVWFGKAIPCKAGVPFAPNHPVRPEENEDQITKYVDDPSGNVQKAKRILREAGWGWDDSGRLRYPADADLSPRWPKGEAPDPDDFPCVNPDGSLDLS